MVWDENIPPYIILLDNIKIKRGKKIVFKLHLDEDDTEGTYIRSSIKGIKSIRITWDGDEYYVFLHKDLGYFMIEKDIIYECNIDCSQWGNLIGT